MTKQTRAAQAFTPGPWLIREELTGRGTICHIIYAPHDQDGGTDLAGIFFMSDYEANARLIAAAPAMFEALKEIEKGEGPYKMDQLEFAESVLERSQDIARAALAKAVGENG